MKEEEGVQREYEGTPIEGYEDFETVSLDGYQWVTDVTLFKAGKNTVTESTATSAKDGIELKAGFTLLAADEMIEQRISAEVQNIRKTLESQAGIYTDITVDGSRRRIRDAAADLQSDRGRWSGLSVY